MNTPSQIAWKKFTTNVPALVGSGYLCLCVLVGIFGYLIVPDDTTHANVQLLELAKEPPGSSATILRVPLSEPETEWGAWLWGRKQNFTPIPLSTVDSLKITGNFVSFQRLSGAMEQRTLEDFVFDSKEINRDEFIQKYVIHRRFLLGTDTYGRDLLSRILLGVRVSLVIGLMSVTISLLIGVVMGLIAGYFGGWVDQVIMWLVSVMWSIPTLLLALAISFVLGKGFWQLFVAIGVSMWVEVARIVRGQILSVKELSFTEAAQALGYPSPRIMFRHILPNVISPIIVIAVANFGAAVLIESGLSFLGIGVEVPIPTWGRMIYEGYTYIVFENGKWLAFFPGIALILLVVSINLIGIGLRDALDIKL